MVSRSTGSTPDESYQYDGLGRGIQETPGGLVTDLYDSDQGQVLEDDQTQQSGSVLQAGSSPIARRGMGRRTQRIRAVGGPILVLLATRWCSW
jgi:hypothetical protein